MSTFDAFIPDPRVRELFHLADDAVVTEDQRREALLLLAHARNAILSTLMIPNQFFTGPVEIYDEKGELCVRPAKFSASTGQ